MKKNLTLILMRVINIINTNGWGASMDACMRAMFGACVKIRKISWDLFLLPHLPHDHLRRPFCYRHHGHDHLRLPFCHRHHGHQEHLS